MKANHEQLIREIKRREQAEETLKERLGFEALLSDLSARFIIVSPEEVNGEIEHALKQIMEFFQVDRCGLIRISKNNDSWEITHVVQTDEFYPLPVNTEMPASMFPWVYAKILGREVVTFDFLRDLPAEASVDKQTYEALGTKANLNIPVGDTRSDIYCLVLKAIRARECSFHFLTGHAQYSHSGIKAGAFHAQDFGCTARPGDFPSRSLEHVANVPSLHFLQRGEVGKGVICLSLHFSGQVELQLIIP